MSNPKFKVGEECFCEFKLSKVKSTEDDRITSVNDGYITQSGYDLSPECQPINDGTKLITVAVNTSYDVIREIAGNTNINYPRIHQNLVELWIKLCESIDNFEEYNRNQHTLSNFTENLCESLRVMKNMEIDGIKILR